MNDFTNNYFPFPSEEFKNKSVLIVGMGGLGCPVCAALAGANVGRLVICDYDTVSCSNLNRQFFYKLSDVGREKVSVAREFLSQFNPQCEIKAMNIFVSGENSREIIKNVDLVICAADNNEVRLALNKICTEENKPLLSTGIAGVIGQIYLFEPNSTPCLFCAIGENESADKRTSCASAQIIGGKTALYALSYLSGDKSKAGKLIVIDTNEDTIDILQIRQKQDCPVCNIKNYIRR